MNKTNNATSDVFFNRIDRYTSSVVAQLACSGNARELRKVLQKGSLHDVCDNRGWFPIHEAVNAGHDKCVKILLKHSKNNFSNTKAYNGETPLFLAAIKGHSNIINILLRYGADINIPNNELVSVLVAATKGGNIDCLKACIDSDVNINEQDTGGWTALHEAAYLGTEKCLELLLSAGAKVDTQNSDGATPLFTAAQYGDKQCLNLLIKHKANVNLGTKDKATPMFIASQEGHIECVQALINARADVMNETAELPTPLHIAAERGNLEIVKLLVKSGADVNATESYQHATPLHLAADKDEVKCLIELIESGADVNAELAESKDTPLEVAASIGSVKCCEELLKRGCDPNRSYLTNETLEATTLMCAVNEEEYRCVEILLKYGADSNKASYTYPIIAAAKNFDQECLRILIRYDADVNLVDRGYNTALRLAVTKMYNQLTCEKNEATQFGCVKILLRAGADTNVLFNMPNCPLSFPLVPSVCKAIPLELIRLLILFGGNRPQLKKIIFTSWHDDDVKWKEVRRSYQSPSDLTHLCRRVIRWQLGPKRISHITELPLPHVLHQFVDFAELETTS